MIDKLEVFKTLELFFPKEKNMLIEIRAISPFSKNDIWSGYFYDYELLWDSIQRFDTTHNLYFVLNAIDRRCENMQQFNQMLRGVQTTQDKDISTREWVLIDIDTEKNHLPISSTDEEWQLARMKTHTVRNYLLGAGFQQPVVCTSGNGLHLLFKVDGWANNQDNLALIERFLKSLSAMFSDEEVDIDVKVGNAARVTKLYGTTAKKGKNTPQRPHRLSKLLLVPDEIKPTPKEYFEKVASVLPVEEKYTTSTTTIRNGESFDIDKFISEHNIAVAKDVTVNGIRKIVLKECPFNPAHTAPDSALFVMPSGAIGFTCFHASCSQYTFKDFRLHYDPNAYEKKDFYEHRNKRMYNAPYPQKPVEPIVATEEKGKIWLKMCDIQKPRFNYADYIPSGITAIDSHVVGFRRGQVSVWTGKRGCGKSSMLNMLILNAAQRGYKSALWTGELNADLEKEWLTLQAAGKQYAELVPGRDIYTVREAVAARIDKWLDKYFWLFNNKYGENFGQIEGQIRQLYNDEKIDVVLLDNLMVLDIKSLDENKYDRQSILLQKLHDLAEELNIHIHLVAHPHKSLGYIQVDNISGSGDISNKAQNIFIMARANTNDFRVNAPQYINKIEMQDIEDSRCTNIVEIGKFRTRGTMQGKIIKFWFEEESNRLKNDIAENITYAWADPPSQIQMDYVQQAYEEVNNTADGMPFEASHEDCPF